MRFERFKKFYLILVVLFLSNFYIFPISGNISTKTSIQSWGEIISDHSSVQIQLGAWLGEEAISAEQVRVKIDWWQQLTGKGLYWYAIMNNFGSSSAPNGLTILNDYKALIDDGLFKGVILTWFKNRRPYPKALIELK